jgi:hypothetical protein
MLLRGPRRMRQQVASLVSRCFVLASPSVWAKQVAQHSTQSKGGGFDFSNCSKLIYAFFSKRVIQTRITAPMKATMSDPMIPPPRQIPSIPKIHPPMTPPHIPRMISTITPYPPPFILFPRASPRSAQPQSTRESSYSMSPSVPSRMGPRKYTRPRFAYVGNYLWRSTCGFPRHHHRVDV